MDPLSDVLGLLKPRSYVSAGFDAGGEWSLAFPRYDGIKFNAVVSGACWLAVEGGAPVRIEAGDCFLLPHGRAFRMASDLALEPVDSSTVFPPTRRGGVAQLNGGGDFFLIGSRFTLAGPLARPSADLLLGGLPPLVHIRQRPDQAALRWSLERMRQELSEGLPGGSLIAEHLAHMMLVQALRLQAKEAGPDRAGWLHALADRPIGAAIGQMHADPARRWAVHQLAREVGMSRTAFAVRFKRTVGLTPMAYLTRWRMLVAASRLAAAEGSVAAIAAALGYESESAFGTAFKRVMGCSPRHYGRAQAPGRE